MVRDAIKMKKESCWAFLANEIPETGRPSGMWLWYLPRQLGPRRSLVRTTEEIPVSVSVYSVDESGCYGSEGGGTMKTSLVPPALILI